VFTPGRWFFDLFAFNPRLTVEQPWTLVTYMFGDSSTSPSTC
jgi:hypothetical protein